MYQSGYHQSTSNSIENRQYISLVNEEEHNQQSSIIQPPSSPTLSSYNYEETNQWLKNYPNQQRELLAHKQQSIISNHYSTLQGPIPFQNHWTTELRENLLQYAHTLYSTTPTNPLLLSLLHSIHDAYPAHLPTLLLLACVYYSHQDYASSLRYNQLILKYDPHYVEAMSNIGTTLRILGQTSEAEKWWYQAVRLRPGYWDAVENLVGILCSTQIPNLTTRFQEALDVCIFVEDHFYKRDKTTTIIKKNPISAPKRLPSLQMPRLQNLFYAMGNLKSAMGDILGAQLEYEKGLELVFGGSSLVSVIHLLVLVCGSNTVQMNESSLPLVLLQPDQAIQILQLMYPHTAGLLPGLVGLSINANKQSLDNTQSLLAANALRQTMQTTSTILLNLAKLLQDRMNSPLNIDDKNTTTIVTSPSLSIILPLYYFSLALNPSPSTANNLGILLSNLNGSVTSNAIQLSNSPPLPGTIRAMQYYMYGLGLDARHPHLYTNLGSLLKDMGHLQEAICMYEKAVEFNPKFDVALANLGNAIKDQGRVQDSVQFYRRAVQANPGFVDAICGLVNSLGGICDWRGRGTVDSNMEATVDEDGHFIPAGQKKLPGWMNQLVHIVEKQLDEGHTWGKHILQYPVHHPSSSTSETMMTVGEYLVHQLARFTTTTTSYISTNDKRDTALRLQRWKKRLEQWTSNNEDDKRNEGGWLMRLFERLIRRMQRHWYLQQFGAITETNQPQKAIVVDDQLAQQYQRPHIPTCLTSPPIPTVLPFHTFTYPLTARQIRLISHRNALRISHTTLTSSWLAPHVYPPPRPPCPRLKIGYVSSDFNNHPLAHLMQSVFGFHDRKYYDIHCYATTPTDSTCYRQKIETETEHFLDVSQWSNQQVVERIVNDGIHVLVNLNGYTKGARNEIFAARPAPVQCSFMGFAGTLGGGWCDWIIADSIVCPPGMVSCEVDRKRRRQRQHQQYNVFINNDDIVHYSDLEGDVDPEEPSDDFVYTEKFIYMPHSYFVNDHKQGFQDQAVLNNNNKDDNNNNNNTTWMAELNRRRTMRHEVFPGLPDDVVIFANFNQLYKLEPSTFRLWLRILERVPNSILWLLRFPPAGEQHLKQCTKDWVGEHVAKRLFFTDVAPKQIHIYRGRVADIFLDTPECNAHTTAADILWSGTPMLTYPKYEHKMCSRVGASIAYATGYGDEMVVTSEKEYEERAVQWAQGLLSLGNQHGSLMDLRKRLFLTREHSRLFDTERWTRNLERGLHEAWRRWVTGQEMEDLSPSSLNHSGCIWIIDPDDKKNESSNLDL
ncbi:glycosyl transferase family 41-domain-containing protein [Halteromyces radiatus]|uniref:glycosyl transferase family 41-domain-containing protein n=1 Tax=Halteromyces radiatus TaxID=101107 RepID=UPI00221FDFE0|nr:glycosyl transferase family 41-domain-containing protein [Halteromyces radiatus]KAI8089349.1 glycosyl transferase family 41-domain-containing protein [Halteromyces radiatus]